MGKVFWRAALMAMVAAVSAGVATEAQAAGALVVGKAPDVRGALAYGWTADYRNEGEAKYQALLYCLEADQLDNVPQVKAACRLITVFNKQCFGFAWDARPTENTYSWAVHPDKTTAETEAVKRCNAAVGYAGACVLEKSYCDTVGSGAAPIASAPSSTAVPVGVVAATPAQEVGGRGAKKR
jgi:Domain of unknown function (DUF4189)